MSNVKHVNSAPVVINIGGGGATERVRPFATLDASEDNLDISKPDNTTEKPKRAFSAVRAAGRFVQGAVGDTIDGIFSLKGLLTIGATAGAVAVFGTPMLALVGAGGLIAGGVLLASGISKAISRYNSGDNEGAENAFRTIGSGAVATGLSFTALNGFKYRGKQILDGFKGNANETGVVGAFKNSWGTLKSFFGKGAPATEAGGLAGGVEAAAANPSSSVAADSFTASGLKTGSSVTSPTSGVEVVSNTSSIASGVETVSTAGSVSGAAEAASNATSIPKPVMYPTSAEIEAFGTGVLARLKDGSVSHAAVDRIVGDHVEVNALKERLESL